MILSLILTPIIGCIIILLKNKQSNIRLIGLITSIINLFISFILFLKFDANCTTFQFVYNFEGIIMGIDGLSLFFILLTTFITSICLLSQWINEKAFNICFLMVSSLLILIFVVLDVMFFYIAFESVLIPMFFIIGIYGARQRKIHAAYYFFLYTLFGSLFMLLSIIFIYILLGTTDYISLTLITFSTKTQLILWLGFFISFGIKTPLIPFHLWLIEAHAESPVSGSVILAGLLLKLATYGYLRFSLLLFPDALVYFSPMVYLLAIISIIYSSLSTLRQVDLKKTIAYSSIGHMSVMLLGLFSNTVQGIEGSILFSLAHGFVSPALFILVTMLYDRTGTRIIKYYRGITTLAPLFSIFFFLFTLANIGAPLTANYIGELLCLMGAFQFHPFFAGLGTLSLILGGSYGLWLYNRIAYGKVSPYLFFFYDLTLREFTILIPLLFLTFLLGIAPNIVLDSLHLSVSNFIINI